MAWLMLIKPGLLICSTVFFIKGVFVETHIFCVLFFILFPSDI